MKSAKKILALILQASWLWPCSPAAAKQRLWTVL